MKTHRLIVTAAVLAMALAPFPSSIARAAEPYEIDAILSLTGPFAFLGKAEATSLTTLEPIVNKRGGINGRPVHFVIHDDQSAPAVAVQLANAIIAKHVPVMLGPTYVASCLAVAPLVKASGPVQYCFAPTIHPPAGSYTFSGGASSRDQAVETLNFALAKGWKRFAAISTTDATGQDIEAQFVELVGTGKYSAMSFVEREHFNPSDVTAAAQIAKMKAANPDAILACTVGAATGTMLRGLKEGGVDTLPVITNLGNLLHTQLDQYVQILPRQIYFTAPRVYAHDVSRSGPVRDAQTAFYQAFKGQGARPDVGNNFPWDPTQIVIEGLRKLGPKADAKSLLDYIEHVNSFAGTDGIYNYRDGSQRGQGLNSLVIVRWNAAKKDVETVSEPGGKPLR